MNKVGGGGGEGNGWILGLCPLLSTYGITRDKTAAAWQQVLESLRLSPAPLTAFCSFVFLLHRFVGAAQIFLIQSTQIREKLVKEMTATPAPGHRVEGTRRSGRSIIIALTFSVQPQV